MKRRYQVVHHFDVWGHAPQECSEYGCDCVVKCDNCDGDSVHPGKSGCEDCSDTGEIHDSDACDCHFDVNDSSNVGEITIDADESAANSDAAILAALKTLGLLAAHVTLGDVDIDEPGDYIEIKDHAAHGRPFATLYPIE